MVEQAECRAGQEDEEKENMRQRMQDLWIRLHRDESGQGLIEYVLLVALIAFAATAGMSSLASSINSAFLKVGTFLAQYIS